MRKLLIFMMTLMLLQLLAVTKEQDSENDKFLLFLEENTIKSLELISAYNVNIARTEEALEGEEIYSKFLLDLTMELSNIRTKINEANSLSRNEKENAIKEIIKIIRPDLKIPIVDYEVVDLENKKYLLEIEDSLKEKMLVIQQNIIEEERICLEEKTITKNMFSFQTHNFLYMTLVNYISSSEYLSSENRYTLTEIVKAIQFDLLKAELEKNKK